MRLTTGRMLGLLLAMNVVAYDAAASREFQTIYSIGGYRVKTPASLGTAVKLLARDEPAVRVAWQQVEERARNAFRAPLRLAPLGVPLQQALANNELNEDAARTLVALTYAFCVTGNQHYRAKSLEYLRAFATTFPAGALAMGVETNHQRHTLYARDWLPNLALAYDVLYNDMSSAERNAYGAWLRGTVGFIQQQANWDKVRRTSHAAWYAAAVGIVGSAIGDDRMVQIAEQRMRVVCDRMLGQDGFWATGSLLQQYSATRALLAFSEATLLRSDYAYKWHNARGESFLRLMLEAPLGLVDPFGAIPSNDRTPTRVPPGDIYLIAGLRYNDPLYRAFARQAKDDSTPELILRYGLGRALPHAVARPAYSIVSPTLGWAVLRTPNVPPARQLYARLEYGQHGGRFGHADKLNLYLCGFGRRVTIDDDRYGIESPLRLGWAKQTLAHNTVVVNYRSQLGAESLYDAGGQPGTLLLFDRTPFLSVAEADARNVYPMAPLAVYRRCIVLADTYALDIFTLVATRAITADWVFHGAGKDVEVLHAILGERSLNNEMVENSLLGSDKYGYRWIDDVSSYTANEQWSVTWGSGLHTIMMGQPDTRVLLGRSGGEASLIGDRIENRTHTTSTLIARRANVLDTRFVALHEILSTNLPFVTSFARLETGVDALVLEVTGKRFRDIFILQSRRVPQQMMVDDTHQVTMEPRRYAYLRFALPGNKIVTRINCSVTAL